MTWILEGLQPCSYSKGVRQAELGKWGGGLGDHREWDGSNRRQEE